MKKTMKKLIICIILFCVGFSSSAQVILDELDGSTIGNATGVTYTSTPNGQGAVFTRASESRIEYPFSLGLPHEGTIEMLIKVSKGYFYDNYILKDNQSGAFIFNTGPSDVWYLGAMWLVVDSLGGVSLSTALTANPTSHSLSASNTTFRFNEWHIVSFSYGSQGQYLKVDGQLVASNNNYKETLQACGSWGSIRDNPTIGKMKSVFWVNNRYDQGFEGILDRFRASSSQQDWKLALNSAQSVTVTEPNGGENWTVNSFKQILWKSNNVTNVRIEYSINGGSAWNTIISSTSAVVGSYTWTVPNSISTNCKMRISDALNSTTNDISDGLFSIVAKLSVTIYPQLFLSSGSILVGNQNIVSGSGFSPLDFVKLNFSINGAQSFQTVQTDYQGIFSYIYTSSASNNNYYVQVSATDITTNKNTITKTFQVKATDVAYKPTLNLQTLQGKFLVNKSIPVWWSDKMYLSIAGISYAHDKNGIRDYSYTASYSTDGSSWTDIKIVTGTSPSDKIQSFTINFKPTTTSDNYLIRITDNFNTLNTITSSKFSISDNSSPLDVSLQWDYSFPQNGVENPIGLAADGVARILIKVRHANGSTIKSATIQLQDKDNNTSISMLGKIMPSTAPTAYSEEANSANKTQATISTASSTDWFWYVAPDNFAENGNSDSYAYSNHRIVQAVITAYDGDTTIQNIEIVRPPLMMVHGLGSDYNCFKHFNYSYNGTNINLTDMETDGGIKTNLFKQRHAINLADPIGLFSYNASQLNSIYANKNNFRGNINALREKGYACNQIDYVCHSMGGCVMREAIESYSTYFSKSNYSMGFIHKAITIDTPHNGSPLADLITEFTSNLDWKNKLFFTYLYGLTDKCIIFNFIQPKDPDCNLCVLNFDASDAVKNLQVNNGVKFNETNVKSHLIAGDVDLISSNTAIAFASMDGYLDVLDKLFEIALKMYPSSELKAVVYAEKGLRVFTFLEWYSKQKGYPNFFADGDFIVPLASQIAINPANSIYPSFTTIKKNSSWWNANHLQIVDRTDVGNRVLELLNSNINDDIFANSIPANNTNTSFQVRQLVKEHLKSTSIETFDTTKIKIINPIRNSALYSDSICKLTYHLKDTTNLFYVSYYYQGNSDMISARDSIYTLKIQNNQKNTGKQMVIVSAVYDTSDGTETYTDTLSVNVQTLASLRGFEVSPKRIEMYKGTKYYPTYTAIYNNNIVNIPINCEDIKVTIGDPSIVTYNASNYSFVGIDTLATYTEISYKGLKDTIYFNVMDTISYSKDSYTEVKEIQNNVSNNFYTLYPNPTKGLFTINIVEPIKQEAKIIVSNLLGETVLQQSTTGQKTILNMNLQPAGIYIIRVIIQDKSQCIVKLIKQE